MGLTPPPPNNVKKALLTENGFPYDYIGQAPLWEGGQTVLGLEGGGIHMKLGNSK